MGTTLVINPGSSSRKYALFHDRKSVVELRYEATNIGFEMCASGTNSQQVCSAISREDFASAFDRVAAEVKNYLQKDRRQLDTVCIRIVAPGTAFQKHQRIDDAYLTALRQRESAAPLHIPTILLEIQRIRKHFPTVKMVAASDSAFHATLPEVVRNFSIDRSDAEIFDIYRFGFHGLSVSSIVRRVHATTGANPERLIVCHIGNGASVTAVKDGKSVDTTMGFSPASGLPMGSRAGDLDPEGLLELMRLKNLKTAETEVYLNTRGGLQGLSGDSDIRQLLDRRTKGDAVATGALDHFAYHVQKAIASFTVALGGLDMVVLTGTAAVRSSELRALLLGKLAHLGIVIDEDKNHALVGQDGTCSVHKSSVKVVVMRTDEMGEMAAIVDCLNLSS